MNKVAHGGEILSYDQKLIDFSANINPMGLSAKLKEILVASLSDIEHYPQISSSELRDKIAKQHSLKKTNILVGNGSIELMYLLASMLPGKQTLCLRPSFGEYEYMLEQYGQSVIYHDLLEENDFEFNVEQLVEKLSDVDNLFIANPNNPTARAVSYEEIEFLLKICREKGILLIVDEAFVDFVDEHVTIIDSVADYENLIIFRSMTKIYALAGLRLGYVVASEKIIDSLARKLSPWNVNVLAQKAGLAVVEDDDYLVASKQLLIQEKKYLKTELDKIDDLKVFDSDINFFLIKILNNKFIASKLKNQLLRHNILIRDCSTFNGLSDSFIRVAVRTREENTILINALNEIFNGVLINAS